MFLKWFDVGLVITLLGLVDSLVYLMYGITGNWLLYKVINYYSIFIGSLMVLHMFWGAILRFSEAGSICSGYPSDVKLIETPGLL